ncbi:MAG TPA: putative manganese-dependent inorganic diphosphatase [Candidatus Cloacimonadota bacterium]|nr:putative manganese-dependent inorganic diphosphatase [Candidatus Cloacimonadota bacterium]HPM02911.1 putative manganese-dependent inorganic diphosphatase [Candidatus Cloacimonadota bacterium]
MNSKDLIYITGHKNPDSDSICSAIAYAEYLKKNGQNAQACRLGEISRETEYILNYFNVPQPQLLKTVRTQISDLDIDPAIPVTADSTIQKAWVRMKQNNIKTLPVVDEENHLFGLITLSDIANKYLDTIETNVIGSRQTTLRNILETINAVLICGTQNDFPESGKVMIAAMQAKDMEPFIEEKDIIIVGNRSDIQIKALECKASCIIITGNAEVCEEVIQKAQSMQAIVMVSPHDTFTTARLISQSIMVSCVMTTENLIRFNMDDFVDDIKTKMLQTRYRSYPVVDDNNVIKGFISRYHLISSRKKKIILVDHNEKSQTVDGIDEAEIIEIIDHHRYGDIQTAYPIHCKLEPVGSTATIIANIFFDNAIRPSRVIAGILCAAIISDTMNFKSPTTVYKDRITAEKLAEINGLDMEAFAVNMIHESSSITGKTAKEIVHEDYKEFKLSNLKFAISQIKTMDVHCIDSIENEIIEYMNQLALENQYHLVMLVITDIIREGSLALTIGDRKDLIEKAFNVEISDNRVYLPGLVSRKKQIIPVISGIV